MAFENFMSVMADTGLMECGVASLNVLRIFEGKCSISQRRSNIFP